MCNFATLQPKQERFRRFSAQDPLPQIGSLSAGSPDIVATQRRGQTLGPGLDVGFREEPTSLIPTGEGSGGGTGSTKDGGGRRTHIDQGRSVGGVESAWHGTSDRQSNSNEVRIEQARATHREINEVEEGASDTSRRNVNSPAALNDARWVPLRCRFCSVPGCIVGFPGHETGRQNAFGFANFDSATDLIGSEKKLANAEVPFFHGSKVGTERNCGRFLPCELFSEVSSLLHRLSRRVQTASRSSTCAVQNFVRVREMNTARSN